MDKEIAYAVNSISSLSLGLYLYYETLLGKLFVCLLSEIIKQTSYAQKYWVLTSLNLMQN